jgi:hypothetical protein
LCWSAWGSSPERATGYEGRGLSVAAGEIAAETHGSRRFRAQRGVLWRCTLRVRASKGGGSAAIELTGQQRSWVAARAAWSLAATAVATGASRVVA